MCCGFVERHLTPWRGLHTTAQTQRGCQSFHVQICAFELKLEPNIGVAAYPVGR